MKWFNTESPMLVDAKRAKFQCNPFLQTLIFIALFFVTNIASSLILSVYLFIELINSDIFNSSVAPTTDEIIQHFSNLSSPAVLINLFSTVIVTILVIVYCKFIEKRSLKSMGLIKKNALNNYLKGYAIGIIIFSLAYIIAVLTGSLSVNGFNSNISFGLLLLFFIGFLIQGMEEEVLLRGYFMISLSNRAPMVVAIMVNSIAFAILHLANPGITILAFINLILFGVFASVYVIKTGNLWGACAIHSAWNFFQGNIYGIQVSGLDIGTTVLNTTTNSSLSIINGGSFGMEGGLAVTIVLLLSIIVTLFIKQEKNNDC